MVRKYPFGSGIAEVKVDITWKPLKEKAYVMPALKPGVPGLVEPGV